MHWGKNFAAKYRLCCSDFQVSLIKTTISSKNTNHRIQLHREEKLDQYLLELKFVLFSKNAKLSFLDMRKWESLWIWSLFVKNHVIWLSSSRAHFWDNLRLFAFLGLEVQIELAPFVIIRESYHPFDESYEIAAWRGKRENEAEWRVRVSFTNNHERSCKYFWSCFYKWRIWFTNYAPRV